MPELVRTSKNETSPVEPLIKRNEVVRSETERLLNHLTELWGAVETKILSMQPPRHIECEYEASEYWDVQENYCIVVHEFLGLQRHGNKWRVCYGYSSSEVPEMSWRPINDCSTEVRVEAAKHIDKLMEEVVRSGKEYIPKVKSAIESLENAIADI
jgi:hypothetical protein